jgi:hypothetical protein
VTFHSDFRENFYLMEEFQDFMRIQFSKFARSRW